MDYSRIFGIEVACVDRNKLLTQVREWLNGPEGNGGIPRTLSYVNAHCLNIAHQNEEYHSHLRTFDLIYPDGVGAVWAGKWLTGNKMFKITGADWIDDFCDLAQISGWQLYILGGKPGVAKKAREKLLVKYPNLIIVGAKNGYWAEAETQEVIDDIYAAQPDVLFVGLGVPRQEAWISRWKIDLPVKVCWAVGALFDYVAGVEPRAPVWMREYDLEWLWRLMVDPSGKWKRYLIGNPLFFARVIKNKFIIQR